MGYTTNFTGHFELDKPLTEAQADYLKAFAETRRVKRNSKIAISLPDEKRAAVNLPIGKDGEYFTGGKGFMGQDEDDSILASNDPPANQPSLWCQWIPTEDRKGIKWDGSEKFYHYIDWLEYIIKHFLEPWGYKLNGSVKWYGEDNTDMGIINVIDNKMEVRKAIISF